MSSTVDLTYLSLKTAETILRKILDQTIVKHDPAYIQVPVELEFRVTK